MDHITNDTSLIGPCDVIPVGAQNPRFPVVGHRSHPILVGGVVEDEVRRAAGDVSYQH